eukprot:g5113.t1
MSTNFVYRYIFGSNPNISGSVCNVDGSTFSYPAGHGVVIIDRVSKKQNFLSGHPESTGITAVAISPNKEFIAFAEGRNSAKEFFPSFTVFKTDDNKKERVIHVEETSENFAALAFSTDGTLLLGVTVGQKPKLFCWNWATSQLIAMADVVQDSDSGCAVQCCFSTVDPTLISVCGEGFFKFFRLDESSLLPIAIYHGKRQHSNYKCHSWLEFMTDHQILVGERGDLLLYGSGKFIKELQCSPGASDGSTVYCITSLSRGFMCGLDNGVVVEFEKTEDPDELFTLKKTHKIPNEKSAVVSLAVTLAEDQLCCMLSNGQVYHKDLTEADPMAIERRDFSPLTEKFHEPQTSKDTSDNAAAFSSAAITGMDTCSRKPLVITCGKDCSVRIWNYETGKCNLVQHFPDEALSVAIHPSSYHILIGFSDKLRLMNVLIDTMKASKEFPVKNCTEVRFSKGGHLFACAYNNAIQVYSTFTCELVTTLRGHNGKVKSIWWADDDAKILSAGLGGSVYQWDVLESKREVEFVKKSIKFTSAILSQDCKMALAVGSDNRLKKLDFPEAKIISDKEAPQLLSQVVLGQTGRFPLVFTGSAEANMPSSVTVFRSLDLSKVGTLVCCRAPITRLCLSDDDNLLFVGGGNGTLAIIEVLRGDAISSSSKPGTSRSGNGSQFTQEVLVNRSDLEEKAAFIEELEGKVQEMEMHNEYQLRLKDMTYSEQIKELADEYKKRIFAEKERYQLLRAKISDREGQEKLEVRQLQETRQHELQKLEAEYQQLIMGEVEAYQELKHDVSQQKIRCEERQKKLVATHELYVEEITSDYEQKLDHEKRLRSKASDETKQAKRAGEEGTNQLAEDIDTEIESLKSKYIRRLDSEREATLRYKGENGIMKKKFTTLTKDIEDQREEIRSMMEKEKKLFQHINVLGQEIQVHKRAIRERDETIGSKEKDIYDLKKKNQELEKFKFVLDYKIKELKRQIEPREKEITRMKNAIKETDKELEKYHKSNSGLDKNIGQLRKRLDAKQKDIMSNRRRIGDQRNFIRRYCNDVHGLGHASGETLDKGVLNLYEKYVSSGDIDSRDLDSDIALEYDRQKRYLEKSVDLLKRQLEKDTATHKAQNGSLVTNNMNLIGEMEDLRRLIKQTKEAAFEKQEKRQKKMASQETLRLMDHQREELRRIKQRITECETSLAQERPGSRGGGKLPPLAGGDTVGVNGPAT